jgi:type VI secretion system protein ImpM
MANDVLGWFGKLPSTGDFVQRRLPSDFVQAWDDWLAQELGSWQSAEPDGWLTAYLAGPSWRFVLLPGCLAGLERIEDGMAGVLMPSVDRVGRYFPLTIAWALPVAPGAGGAVHRLFAQLREVDNLALEAVQNDWTVQQLDDALASHTHRHTPSPQVGRERGTGQMPASGMADELAWRGDIVSTLADIAIAGLFDCWRGVSLWWSEALPGHPRLRVGTGLPRGDSFIELFQATTPPESEPSDSIGGLPP